MRYFWRQHKNKKHRDNSNEGQADSSLVCISWLLHPQRTTPLENFVVFFQRRRHTQGVDQFDVAVGQNNDGNREAGHKPNVGEWRVQGRAQLEYPGRQHVDSDSWALDSMDFPQVRQRHMQADPAAETQDDGRDCVAASHELTRLDRAGDGKVPGHGQDDREPGGGFNEDVIDAVAIERVVEREVPVVMDDIWMEISSRDGHHAEAQVRPRQRHHAHQCPFLHGVHTCKTRITQMQN